MRQARVKSLKDRVIEQSKSRNQPFTKRAWRLLKKMYNETPRKERYSF